MVRNAFQKPFQLSLPFLVAGLLAALGPSCGDFTLFEGSGGGGGNGGGGSNEVCPNVFTDLTGSFTGAQLSPEGALTHPAAMAVVPPGMSFTYNSLQAKPGDVLVADREKGKIYLYPEGAAPSEMLTVQAPAGLALFAWDDGLDEEDEIQLLFYSSATRNSVYIADLAGTLFGAGQEQVEVTNAALGSTLLLEPTALAAFGDQDQASLFVLNRNGGQPGRQSVVRIRVSLTATPGYSTTTVARNFSNLRDLAYYRARDWLFFSQSNLEDLQVQRIFRITNATATQPMILDESAGAVPFIEDTVVKNPVGLALAPLDSDGDPAALLVTQPLINLDAFLDYEADSGLYRSARGALDTLLDQPVSIAYDCTNQRILFTNIPQNLGFFSASLWELRR